MKALIAGLAFGLLGVACGVVVSTLNIAFEPKGCGEDCASSALGTLFLWVFVCTTIFAALGLALWRKRRTVKSFSIISIVMLTAFIGPSALLYVYRAGQQ